MRQYNRWRLLWIVLLILLLCAASWLVISQRKIARSYEDVRMELLNQANGVALDGLDSQEKQTWQHLKSLPSDQKKLEMADYDTGMFLSVRVTVANEGEYLIQVSNPGDTPAKLSSVSALRALGERN